jgi:ubiquinone/menaquinone biosynthesis C-methylase UbiE
MSGYYREKLSVLRLKRCYDIAPPGVEQYLNAEIRTVFEKIKPGDNVLELGCGYGRILKELFGSNAILTGIDISHPNIHYAREDYLSGYPCQLVTMDALSLGFYPETFDLVYCTQNGISAFAVDPAALMLEAIRVTRSGGRALFSSYSEKFWEERLHWFQMQSAEGLLGEIDDDRTGNGVIVCKDGFRATTYNKKDFEKLAGKTGHKFEIFEIDASAIFCEIIIG